MELCSSYRQRRQRNILCRVSGLHIAILPDCLHTGCVLNFVLPYYQTLYVMVCRKFMLSYYQTAYVLVLPKLVRSF